MIQNTRQAGRAFVRKVIAAFREFDPATYEVNGSGAGLDKGDVRVPRADLVLEAKAHRQVCITQWTEQADRQGLGHSKTALVWWHPKSPKDSPVIRVDISLEYFLELLARAGEPMIKREDRDFKYKLSRLKQSAADVLKQLGN